jgi:predicted MPP superfamily phosphohydrolase
MSHPAPRNSGPRRWAHWLGRSLAHVHYARHVEPTWLEVNRIEVPVADLPAAFDGFRVVQLSDLHCSAKVGPEFIDEAIDLALAEQPDVVVVTGDFIHHGFRHIAQAAAHVRRLAAPLGVFAVLGNHDYSIRNALGLRRHRHLHQAVADALAAEGVRVLRNETVPLERAGSTLDLSGVDDLWSRTCDLDRALAACDPDRPRVLLAHNPRTVEYLAGRRCDLMLSGHTHGGQVDLPRLGRVVLGRKARRFAAGMYELDGTYLYVNKGVGFGWRLRYNVRPEVAVLTLRPLAA